MALFHLHDTATARNQLQLLTRKTPKRQNGKRVKPQNG